jgi:hypothetical protein
MAKIAQPNGKRKFTLWEMEVGISFNLDFSPFVDRFGLISGLILHWQSKPTGYREWGVYDIINDIYASCPHFETDGAVNITPLEMDDKGGFVPSAVIYFPDGEILETNEDRSVLIGRSRNVKSIDQMASPDFSI